MLEGKGENHLGLIYQWQYCRMLRVWGKRWRLPLVFVEGDTGSPQFGVSWNRLSLNIIFRVTFSSLMYPFMAMREDFLKVFIIFNFFFACFLGQSFFIWVLSPHAKHPSSHSLKATALVSANICIFCFLAPRLWQAFK